MSINKVLLLCLFTSTCYSNTELTAIQKVAQKASIGSLGLATVMSTPGILCKVIQLHLCSLGNFFIGQKFGTLATASFNFTKPLFGASFGSAAIWCTAKAVQEAQKLDILDLQHQTQGNTNYWLNKRLTISSSFDDLKENYYSFTN